MSDSIGPRKEQHIDLCLLGDVGSGASTGLGAYSLEYDALPELDLDDVDLSVQILGKHLRAPILIGALTGGTARTGELNGRLARAAARVGAGMALGSQRAMIERPSCTPTFDVRRTAPDLRLLLGNIGAVQLNYGLSLDAIVRAVEAVRADGLVFHLNPLQEAIQPEGDTKFSGLQARLAAAIPSLPVPCLVKEVGHGISPKTAAKLAGLPIAGIETAGVGGTSWARVESRRSPPGSPSETAGRQLAGFGIPTAAAVRACRAAFGDRLVIASGGIRTGLDAAVALALGADAVALARPLLVAAADSEDAVVQELERIIAELKIVCFCTGAADLRALRSVRVFSAPGAWSVGAS